MAQLLLLLFFFEKRKGKIEHRILRNPIAKVIGFFIAML
jgi:hypothetical protein